MGASLAEIKATALTPCGDRILVQADTPEEKSKGGIIIPETSKLREPGTVGVIIAIGPACKMMDESWVGRQIVFGRYSGHELPDRKDLIVMSEKDVLLGLKKED